MINIVRRKSEAPATLPSLFNDWPRLSDMLRWGNVTFDPFREMIPAFEASEPLQTYMPAFEVKETKENYSFRADIPGVKEDDLKITLTGNRLSISGKREEEKRREDETYYCYERHYGSFTRAFTLPEGVDAEHVKADLKNGQLSILVPKKPELVAKEVNIKLGGDKK